MYRGLHNPMRRCWCGPSPFRAHHLFPLCPETQRGPLDYWQRRGVDWVVSGTLGREVREAAPGVIELKELFSPQGGSDCVHHFSHFHTQLSNSQENLF